MSSQIPSGRTFKVWEYQVSHGQLLVRSPKSPASKAELEQTTNLDLTFNGVEYMALPRLMRGIEFVVATQQEIDSLVALLGHQIEIENIIILRSGEQRFPVVAVSVAVSENTWDIFESPFKFRCQFRG